MAQEEQPPSCALASVAEQFDETDDPLQLRDLQWRSCGRCALRKGDWVQVLVYDWERNDDAGALPEVVISSGQLLDSCTAKEELSPGNQAVNIRYQ